MSVRGAELAWVVAASVAACGGSDGGADAGPPDAGAVMVSAPAPPVLTPCPPGWREVPPESADDVATCDPWPEGGAATCPAGEAHFPGEPGCAPIGSACPAGDWPEVLPGGFPILYARPGAVGGDGSLATPFGTIAEAMAVATPGTTIALAKGTFDEGVRLADGVTLIGACVGATTISTTTPSTEGVIMLFGLTGEVRDVRVTGDRDGVQVPGFDRVLILDGVLVEGALGAGVAVADASLQANRLVVRGTRSRADGTFGRGVVAQQGGLVEINRAVIEANHDYALRASGAGSAITLADAVVRDTLPRGDGSRGVGLAAAGGAQAVVERVVLEGNREVALAALDPGSTITVTDTVVRDTLANPSGQFEFGRGIDIELGAHLEATRVLVDDNIDVGILVGLMGASATIVDVVVRDTLPNAALTGGQGFFLGDSATANVTRAIFTRSRAVAVHAKGADNLLTLTDVVVRDTGSEDASARYGRALEVATGAEVVLLRGRFERNRDIGIYVAEPGSRATFEDVVVLDTAEQACAATATCAWDVASNLSVQNGAYLSVTRFELRRGALCGIQLVDAELDLHQGLVAESPIGVNVQVAGFDLARLQDGVSYVDNGINFDGMALPVPPTAPPPSGF